MQASILVIVVAHKSAAVLPGCLTSLTAQTGVSMRVVVVDNASTDDSAGVAEAHGATVVRQAENIGFAAGCNRGWQAGLKEFAPTQVLYLNPDTRLEDPGLLAALCGRLAAQPEVAIVTPRLVREDGSMDWACRRNFPSLWAGFCRASGLARLPVFKGWLGGYNLMDRPIDGEYPVPCVTGAFMLCAAEFVAAVGGFDERYFMYIEDIEMCWQAQARGRVVLYAGSLTARHAKGHASREQSDAMLAELFKSTRIWMGAHRYPRMGWIARTAARLGLWSWEKLARFKNRWRRRKSAQP